MVLFCDIWYLQPGRMVVRRELRIGMGRLRLISTLILALAFAEFAGLADTDTGLKCTGLPSSLT